MYEINKERMTGYLAGYSSSLALSLLLTAILGKTGLTISLWLALLAALGLFYIVLKNQTKLPGETQ